MAESFVGDLPVLLGSRPKPLEESLLRDIEKSPRDAETSPSDEAPGRRRQPPAPLEFAGESECPERDELWFFVKNTFLEGSSLRSPSLERFYKERSVHTCPSQQIGKLRQLENDSPRNKDNTVRVWEGLPSPVTGFQTPILEDHPAVFGSGNAATLAAAAASSSLSGPTRTAPLAPPAYPPPELDPLQDAAHAAGPPMSLLSTQPPADRVATGSPVLASASPAATMPPLSGLEGVGASAWERQPWDSPTPSLPWGEPSLNGSPPPAPWTGAPGDATAFPFTPYFPLPQATPQTTVGVNSVPTHHQQQPHHHPQPLSHLPPQHSLLHTSYPQVDHRQLNKQVLKLSAVLDRDEAADNWWPTTQQRPSRQPAAAAPSRSIVGASSMRAQQQRLQQQQQQQQQQLSSYHQQVAMATGPARPGSATMEAEDMLYPKPQSAAALGARSIEALLHPGIPTIPTIPTTGASSRVPTGSPTASPTQQHPGPTIPPSHGHGHGGHVQSHHSNGAAAQQQQPHAAPKRSPPGTASTVASWRSPTTTAAQAPNASPKTKPLMSTPEPRGRADSSSGHGHGQAQAPSSSPKTRPLMSTPEPRGRPDSSGSTLSSTTASATVAGQRPPRRDLMVSMSALEAGCSVLPRDMMPPAPYTAPGISAEFPSIGSALHSTGNCRPCAFLHTKGCETGADCQFCHLCSPDERKKRRKAKAAELKSAIRRGLDMPR